MVIRIWLSSDRIIYTVSNRSVFPRVLLTSYWRHFSATKTWNTQSPTM